MKTAHHRPVAGLSPAPLVVRCDGGEKVGAGHIMRCLALAQEWQHQGGEVVFLIPSAAELFRDRLIAEGIRVDTIAEEGRFDAERVRERVEALGAQALVVDGYDFATDFFRCTRTSAKSAVLDDGGDHLDADVDVLINPNPHADAAMYEDAQAAVRLLGARFTPLRREFRFARGAGTRSKPPLHVLVTLGGSDPDDVTSSVLTSLELGVAQGRIAQEAFEVFVLLGPAYGPVDAIERRGAGLPFSVSFAHGARDMLAHYRWADVCISGAGSTTWELEHLRIPQLAICLADNQRPIRTWLEDHGRALTAEGQTVKEDPASLIDKLERLLAAPPDSGASQRVVDGSGPGRVALALGCPFYLRRADERDRRFLFDLANDPASRAMSFTQREIPWEDHVRWYETRLVDPETELFVAVAEQEARVGFVRFQRDDLNEPFEISVAVDPSFRGRGLASRLIHAGCVTCSRIREKDAVVDAFIRPENEASRRAFRKAGFQRLDKTSRGALVAERWRW